MDYYDGLSGRSKVYIAGYIMDEYAAIADCQVRAVDICRLEPWKRELWKLEYVGSALWIHIVWGRCQNFVFRWHMRYEQNTVLLGPATNTYDT